MFCFTHFFQIALGLASTSWRSHEVLQGKNQMKGLKEEKYKVVRLEMHLSLWLNLFYKLLFVTFFICISIQENKNA